MISLVFNNRLKQPKIELYWFEPSWLEWEWSQIDSIRRSVQVYIDQKLILVSPDQRLKLIDPSKKEKPVALIKGRQ